MGKAPAEMTVAVIKKELEARGLDTKGLKAVLVARLEEALAGDATGDAAPAAEPAAMSPSLCAVFAEDVMFASSLTPPATDAPISTDGPSGPSEAPLPRVTTAAAGNTAARAPKRRRHCLVPWQPACVRQLSQKSACRRRILWQLACTRGR